MIKTPRFYNTVPNIYNNEYVHSAVVIMCELQQLHVELLFVNTNIVDQRFGSQNSGTS